ncbi:MAG: hypothetical protein PVH58_14460, partial [Desulfobacterales bacterium]
MGVLKTIRETGIVKSVIISLILSGSLIFGVDLFLGEPSVSAKTADVITAPANFSQLAQMVSPAVVNIRTVKTIKGGGPVFRQFQRDPWGREGPFKDFFEKFFGEDMQREFKQPSLGSGFIIDKQGFVVT